MFIKNQSNHVTLRERSSRLKVLPGRVEMLAAKEQRFAQQDRLQGNECLNQLT